MFCSMHNLVKLDPTVLKWLFLYLLNLYTWKKKLFLPAKMDKLKLTTYPDLFHSIYPLKLWWPCFSHLCNYSVGRFSLDLSCPPLCRRPLMLPNSLSPQLGQSRPAVVCHCVIYLLLVLLYCPQMPFIAPTMPHSNAYISYTVPHCRLLPTNVQRWPTLQLHLPFNQYYIQFPSSLYISLIIKSTS